MLRTIHCWIVDDIPKLGNWDTAEICLFRLLGWGPSGVSPYTAARRTMTFSGYLSNVIRPKLITRMGAAGGPLEGLPGWTNSIVDRFSNEVGTLEG